MWFKAVRQGARPALAAAAVVSGMSAAMAAAPIAGTWQAPNGAEIRIAPCSTGFCGTLSYFVIPEAQRPMCKSMPKDQFAALILDYKNPDKAMQTRSLIGAQILTARPANGSGPYNTKIYNAEDGSTNDVLIWIVNNNATLRLGGGCVGMLCIVTQDWPRVADHGVVPDFDCGG